MSSRGASSLALSIAAGASIVALALISWVIAAPVDAYAWLERAPAKFYLSVLICVVVAFAGLLLFNFLVIRRARWLVFKTAIWSFVALLAYIAHSRLLPFVPAKAKGSAGNLDIEWVSRDFELAPALILLGLFLYSFSAYLIASYFDGTYGLDEPL